MLAVCDPEFIWAFQNLENSEVDVTLSLGELRGTGSIIGEARGAAESKLRNWVSATKKMTSVSTNNWGLPLEQIL